MAEDASPALQDPRVREFLKFVRVAHLATADANGTPHNVPLCFWYNGGTRFYFVVDENPEWIRRDGIKRTRNITENPHVALVVDHYEEDWQSFAYVLIHGEAHNRRGR